MEELIQNRIKEHEDVIKKMLDESIKTIHKIADKIIDSYKNGGKLILFGNGGSCSDSMHLATEFVSRYYFDRKSLPAIALTDNVTISAIGNDYSYDDIFKKQVEGFVKGGDIVIGISTSGNSKNVLKAIEKAKILGAFTIGFTGNKGNMLKNKVDICLTIPSSDTPRIQEGYMLAGHIICEIVEKRLFEK